MPNSQRYSSNDFQLNYSQHPAGNNNIGNTFVTNNTHDTSLDPYGEYNMMNKRAYQMPDNYDYQNHDGFVYRQQNEAGQNYYGNGNYQNGDGFNDYSMSD